MPKTDLEQPSLNFDYDANIHNETEVDQPDERVAIGVASVDYSFDERRFRKEASHKTQLYSRILTRVKHLYDR